MFAVALEQLSLEDFDGLNTCTLSKLPFVGFRLLPGNRPRMPCKPFRNSFTLHQQLLSQQLVV